MDLYTFYKISCNDINITDCYIGKTTNLKQRESMHKYNCNNENSPHHNYKIYKFIREHGGWNNFTLTEIGNHNCNYEASSDYESYFYNLYNASLNTNIPNRDNKTYYEDNKEIIKEYGNVRCICSECGYTYNRGGKTQHLRSKKHLQNIESDEESIETNETLQTNENNENLLTININKSSCLKNCIININV